MKFPFTDDIREKIDLAGKLMRDAQIDSNGVMVMTDEIKTLSKELMPYVMSPEYDAYLIAKFSDMGISLTITEE